MLKTLHFRLKEKGKNATTNKQKKSLIVFF